MNHVLIIRTFCIFFRQRIKQLMYKNLYKYIKNLIYYERSLSSIKKRVKDFADLCNCIKDSDDSQFKKKTQIDFTLMLILYL